MSMAEEDEITKLEQRLDQKILQIVFKSARPDGFHPRAIAPAGYLTAEAVSVTLRSFWDVMEPRDRTWKAGKVQT